MVRQEICSQCGRFDRVAKRIDMGVAICPRCYYRDFYVWPTDVCVVCAKIVPVYARDGYGQAICKRCYSPPQAICTGCGRLAEVSKRSHEGNLCAVCYNKQHVVSCGVCHKIKMPAATHDGTVFCKACHQKWRYANDAGFRLLCQLRNRLHEAIKTYTKNGKRKTAKGYGVDYDAIIAHLEPFPEPLSEFHVDHIFPLAALI